MCRDRSRASARSLAAAAEILLRCITNARSARSRCKRRWWILFCEPVGWNTSVKLLPSCEAQVISPPCPTVMRCPVCHKHDLLFKPLAQGLYQSRMGEYPGGLVYDRAFAGNSCFHGGENPRLFPFRSSCTRSQKWLLTAADACVILQQDYGW